MESNALTDMSVSDYEVDLSRFPSALTYDQCEAEARMQEGPVALNAVIHYYAVYMGGKLDLWKKELGLPLFHAVMADLTPAFLRYIAALKSEDDQLLDETMVPCIQILLMAHAVNVVTRQKNFDAVVHLHQAYHSYVEVAENDVKALLAPFAVLLEEMTERANPKAYQRRVWRAMAFDFMRVSTIPAVSVQNLLEARTRGEEGNAQDTPPGIYQTIDLVEHLDGTLGEDFAPTLRECFMPRRERLDTYQAQLADTLAQFEGPYRDALALWEKVNCSAVPAVRKEENLMLDAVGRVLERLFTREQMALLMERVQVSLLVENIMRFLAEYQTNPPSMSAPQLRISWVSNAIAVVAPPGQMEETGTVILGAMGMPVSEILLYRATMRVHGKVMSQSIHPLNPQRKQH